MILILFLYALCALTFTIGKATLLFSKPFFYVGIRMVCAGAMLYGFDYLYDNQPKRRFEKGDMWILLQISFFSVYCAYVLDLWSLQYITSIESALIFNLSPFIAAFLSYIWFKEEMTGKKIVGLIIGAFSIMPLLLTSDTPTLFFNSSRIVPVIALICAVVSSSYGWILIRELVKNRAYSPFFINSRTMIGGGLLALITSFFHESWQFGVVNHWPNFLMLLFVMIVISNILFSNLYSYLLSKYTATLLAFAGFTCPLFASLFSWFFLNESLNWSFLYSFLTVVVGLILFYQEELRLGYYKNK